METATGTKDEFTFIDTALLAGPKVFAVSTLISIMPATPFLFRNYQYPECIDEDAEDDNIPVWLGGLCRVPATLSTAL